MLQRFLQGNHLLKKVLAGQEYMSDLLTLHQPQSEAKTVIIYSKLITYKYLSVGF